MSMNWENKTILIVDDKKLNYVLLKTQLRKTNATFIWHENGQEVVDYIKNSQHADLILMDVRMPVLNGIEATRMIKTIAPHIPIIIQTACAMGEPYEEISTSGCDDAIFKPIDSNKLIATIIKQFERYSIK